MSVTDSINTIYQIAKSKMNEGEAGAYVGEVLTFRLNQLSENKCFSSDNLERALEEEAEFHLRCKSEDVA